MKLDLSKIKFSNNDIRKDVKIPNILTPKLAEFIGVMVGDGHVGVYKNSPGGRTFSNYEIRISGNLKDYDYYSVYINNLATELFNVRFYILKPKNENSVFLYKNSKALYYFFSNYLGIPQIKDNVGIPEQVLNSTLEVKSSFLRGLADSDFTFMIKNRNGKLYPQVKGCSKSGLLIEKVSCILKEMDITHCTTFEKSYYEKREKLYERHVVYINGFNNIREWFLKIGFSNSRHLEKYQFFLKKRAGEDSNSRPKGNSIR